MRPLASVFAVFVVFLGPAAHAQDRSSTTDPNAERFAQFIDAAITSPIPYVYAVGGATWVTGNVLDAAVDGPFDLILSNEMAGDLPARQLSRTDIGLAAEGGTVDRAKLRAVSANAADLGVALDDAPEPFYLQTGAIDMVARIARWLAPGGAAVVTEFGDVAAWPRLSTQLDHPELSTHFGHLVQAARGDLERLEREDPDGGVKQAARRALDRLDGKE